MSDSLPSDELNRAGFASKNYATPDEDSHLKRLSVSQISTYRWPLERELRALNATQIPAIGLWRPKFLEWGAQHGVDLLRQFEVRVSSVSWAGGFTGSHGFSFSEALDDSREAIELASQVGAECVMVATGSRYGHTKKHAHRLMVDGLKILSDFAAGRNVSLAVVPMAARQSAKWTCLTSLNQAMELILHCNRANVGLGIDLAQLSAGELLLDRIEEIAGHTKLVRLNDCHHEATPGLLSCCPLGEGELPLDEVITRFTRHGYTGFFEFEIRSADIWEQEEYGELLHTCREMFAQSVLI